MLVFIFSYQVCYYKYLKIISIQKRQMKYHLQCPLIHFSSVFQLLWKIPPINPHTIGYTEQLLPYQSCSDKTIHPLKRRKLSINIPQNHFSRHFTCFQIFQSDNSRYPSKGWMVDDTPSAIWIKRMINFMCQRGSITVQRNIIRRDIHIISRHYLK